jgi:methionine sulfoxide reductase heme-binding subunit
MSNVWIRNLKILVFLVCTAPAVWLVAELVTNNLGPDPTANVTFFTGRATLRLLVISLALTPIRRLSPRLTWIIRFRKMLGLFAFFYGCLHLLTYIGLYAYFDIHTMLDDIAKRRFILSGMFAWVLLLPLALTSTNWAIRKMGGKRWQRLHRIVYVAAIAGVVHYWWGVKPGVRSPLPITIILGVLLLARPVTSWWQGRRQAVPRPA